MTRCLCVKGRDPRCWSSKPVMKGRNANRDCRSGWRAARPTSRMPSACATRCSRRKWARSCCKTDDAIDQDEFDPYLRSPDRARRRYHARDRHLPHPAAAPARKLGQLYSEAEFDLSRLTHLRPSLIEVGRSCVHPDHRTGSAILMLWAGLAQYMRSGRLSPPDRLRQRAACRRRHAGGAIARRAAALPGRVRNTGCFRACRFRTNACRARRASTFRP